ncbi:hypothetical protein BH10ACI2_BH10ACI2_04190 [soil metagenome]
MRLLCCISISVLAITFGKLRAMYYTYLPGPDYRNDPNVHEEPYWCIARVDDDGEHHFLTGLGLTHLSRDEAQQKAEQMSADLES